jgi:hypothetical protein
MCTAKECMHGTVGLRTWINVIIKNLCWVEPFLGLGGTMEFPASRKCVRYKKEEDVFALVTLSFYQ